MFRIAVLALALLWPNLAARAEIAGPEQIIEKFHGILLEAMQNAFAEDVTARYARLAPAVEAAFDFPFMVQIAVGESWSSATDQQRQALTVAFGRMSTATYASHFNGYSGETFETLDTRDGPKGTRLVETRIVSPDGGHTDLTYVMHPADDHWRIANVILEKGISQLAVHQSEYAAILRQGGVDKLIHALTAKAETLLTPQ
ncbi:hypothetical protein JCM17960_20850 [Magnetospira thiophila]